MDYSQIQRILNTATTRGTAIITRTVRDIIQDKKTILIALVSLFPIIIGIVWSSTLSSSEDLREVPVNERYATGEIYCTVDIPDYLPDEGNYTFTGEVRNKGDSTRLVAINITLGGLRKSTGIFNLPPTAPHQNSKQFNITFNMNPFEHGYTFIMVQLYVNGSAVARRFPLPEEMDLFHLNLTQFDPEEIFGNNYAIYAGAIMVKPLAIEETEAEIKKLAISTETDFMPLTLTYPETITPDTNNTLNCSIASPVAESQVKVEIVELSSDNGVSYHDTIVRTVTNTSNYLNFSFRMKKGFSDYGFNIPFQLLYTIILDNRTIHREEYFIMDIVPEDYLGNPNYRQIVLRNNTAYTAGIHIPSIVVYDGVNRLPMNLTNEMDTEAVFNIRVSVNFYNNINQVKQQYNFSQSFVVAPHSILNEDFRFEFTPQQKKEMNSSAYANLTISMTVNGLTSCEVYSGPLEISSLNVIIRTTSEILTDTFVPSFQAAINMPEDISTKYENYTLTGTIRNDAGIEKEFYMVVTIQEHTFRGDNLKLDPHELGSYKVIIETEKLSKEFNTPVEVALYSTAQNGTEEAHITTHVNVIDISHKERKAIENFLGVYTRFFLQLIVPLVSMVFGVSLIAHEKERRTLSAYLTTPISRTELVLYKFGGYLIGTTLILTLPLIFIYLSFSHALSLRSMIYYTLLLGVCIFDQFLAIAAYGALFTAIGTMGKRPLLIGLSYLMIWEVFTGNLNIFLSQYTLFYHIKCAVLPFVERFVPDAIDIMNLKDLAGNDFTVPMELSMFAIIISIFFFLFLSVYILNLKDVD